MEGESWLVGCTLVEAMKQASMQRAHSRRTEYGLRWACERFDCLISVSAPVLARQSRIGIAGREITSLQQPRDG